MLNIDHLDNQMSIANIREMYGLSKKQIADKLGITLQDLALYEADPEEISVSMMRKITNIQQEFKEKRNVFHYTNPYPELRAKFKHNKQRLIHELNQVNVSEIAKKIFIEDILVHQQYYDRKPRVGVFGGFDVGKSSLGNILLEGDYLPVGYQPMTNIACILRHIDDKPKWQSGHVLMLDEEFNIREIDDAEYCQQHLLFDTHLEFFKQMTHQTIQEIVYYAIVYLDAPILKCCDLIDIPGYGNNDQDTSIADNIIYDIDVILYLSKLDGFLGQEQIQPLSDLLYGNNMIYEENLDKLYVILTHADGIDLKQGSIHQVFDSILDKSVKRVYQAFKDEYKGLYGHKAKKFLKEKDFRKRFFTFSALNSNLRSSFEHDLSSLLKDVLPKYMRYKFYEELRGLESGPHQSFLTGMEKSKEINLINYNAYEDAQNKHMQMMVEIVKSARYYRSKSLHDISEFMYTCLNPIYLKNIIHQLAMNKEDTYKYMPEIIVEKVENYMVEILNDYVALFSSIFKTKRMKVATHSCNYFSENTFKHIISFNRSWQEIAAEDIYEQLEENKYIQNTQKNIEKYWENCFNIAKHELIESEIQAYQILSSTIANYK
ncbi:MAG: dynamin family protein [Erysipelotrichaceae bacterium]